MTICAHQKNPKCQNAKKQKYRHKITHMRVDEALRSVICLLAPVDRTHRSDTGVCTVHTSGGALA